jgi:hypothetical protein
MAEIRYLDVGQEPPEDADWVHITLTPGGRFMAHGSVEGDQGATFYTPPSSGTLAEALAAANEWATENHVPVVYVSHDATSAGAEPPQT